MAYNSGKFAPGKRRNDSGRSGDTRRGERFERDRFEGERKRNPFVTDPWEEEENGTFRRNRENRYQEENGRGRFSREEERNGRFGQRRRSFRDDSERSFSQDRSRGRYPRSDRFSERPDSRDERYSRFSRFHERGSDDRYGERRFSDGRGRSPERDGRDRNRVRRDFPEERGGFRFDRGYSPFSASRRKVSERDYNNERHQENEQKKENGYVRLNRYIANAGICSRREADEMIRSGVIKVNGEVCTTLGTMVGPDDRVQFGGQTLRAEKKVYLLMNKPKGYITTADDPEERKTVMDLIRGACKERIYPVGRLDRNTTGVLLFTNDGDMAKRLTHPSHGARKIYHVTLDNPLSKSDLQAIAKGVVLEDGLVEVDEIDYVESGNRKEIGIQLHSGKNRVVRRIFEHFGYVVTKLDRVLFAELTKKDLGRGHWRFLTEKEIGFLQMNAGKRENVSVKGAMPVSRFTEEQLSEAEEIEREEERRNRKAKARKSLLTELGENDFEETLSPGIEEDIDSMIASVEAELGVDWNDEEGIGDVGVGTKPKPRGRRKKAEVAAEEPEAGTEPKPRGRRKKAEAAAEEPEAGTEPKPRGRRKKAEAAAEEPEAGTEPKPRGRRKKE